MVQPHTPAKRKLSDISHLFLSNVRQMHTEGAQAPSRTPPGGAVPHVQAAKPAPATDAWTDWTPARPAAGGRRVTLVVTQHLAGESNRALRQLAATACGTSRRVALLKLDHAGIHVSLFDPANEPAEETLDEPGCVIDPRQIADALHELDVDVDEWLLTCDEYRSTEARRLLGLISRAMVLAHCDHDGIVAAYRTLKGMPDEQRPFLTVGLLDVHDAHERQVVYSKLAGVCQKFLTWPVAPEPVVVRPLSVAEHTVLARRGTHDKATLATLPHWRTVVEFLGELAQDQTGPAEELYEEVSLDEAEVEVAAVEAAASVRVRPEPAKIATTVETPAPAAGVPVGVPVEVSVEPAAVPHLRLAGAAAQDADEVIELTGGIETLSARFIARQGWSPSAVTPPGCTDLVLAADEAGRLQLVAALARGLSRVTAATAAVRWASDNLALIAMAQPQLKLDASKRPALTLLVDHADATAAALAPLADAGQVQVQTYRRLKFAGRTGVLLEAA